MKIALIQLGSTANKEKNMAKATQFCNEAIAQGVDWILLPEVFNYRAAEMEEQKKGGEPIPGNSTSIMQNLAKKHGIAILLGSMSETITGSKKVANTSVFINSFGAIAATYRKIHLFDVNLTEKPLRESDAFICGQQPVVTEFNNVKIGLSICYDLRFPELYTYYSAQGCDILCVPASFTKSTGEAHWEVLLRARAIENHCFVLAPNQVGIGGGGIQTYGNSMVIDPWGKILARGDGGSERILIAELNLDLVRQCRAKIPVIAHRRDLCRIL